MYIFYTKEIDEFLQTNFEQIPLYIKVGVVGLLCIQSDNKAYFTIESLNTFIDFIINNYKEDVTNDEVFNKLMEFGNYAEFPNYDEVMDALDRVLSKVIE